MWEFLSWSLRGCSEPASQARGLAWILEPGSLELMTWLTVFFLSLHCIKCDLFVIASHSWDLKKIMSLLTLPLTNGNISGPLWQTDLPDKKYFPAPRFLVLDLPQITFRPVSSSRVTPCVLFSASLPNKGLQMMQWRCLTAQPACGWTSLVPVALTVRWAWPWSFPTDDLLTSWPVDHGSISSIIVI